MTKEEKQLLLKDLCARLPYGVIVDYKENEFEIPHWKITTIYPNTFDGWIGYDRRVGAGSESGSRPFKIGEVKPYLRPMSSMNEEERKELRKLCEEDLSEFAEFIKDGHGLSRDGLYMFDKCRQLDFCLSHHLDFRGLIPMGLALEATEGMYEIE